jgi:hypothetical protein
MTFVSARSGSAARYPRHHSWRVILLINGLDIQIISPDGQQLRKLTLDPAKDYQPLGGP